MRLVFSLFFFPDSGFDKLKNNDYFHIGVILMLIRWSVTPLTTVFLMYRFESPMLLPVPMRIAPSTYRFYEIFWYGPYGLLMMGTVVLVVFKLARFLTDSQDISLKKVCELVSFTFFTPWLVSVVGDPLLVLFVNAHPAFLVPFHVAILTIECFFLALGFHRVYSIPFWRQCTLLGLAAGVVFVAMGAPIIR